MKPEVLGQASNSVFIGFAIVWIFVVVLQPKETAEYRTMAEDANTDSEACPTTSGFASQPPAGRPTTSARTITGVLKKTACEKR